MSTPSPLVDSPPVPSKSAPRGLLRRNSDTLGIAWMHGSFHAAVFRRQSLVASWSCDVEVPGVEDFEYAFDSALGALGFKGEEVFLILAHDQFIHQAEQAPAFSEAASRSYLRGRVERHEKEQEPVLWVSQRTLSARQESAFVLHMLPSAFYGRLNSLLLARRLDLTRILPVSVPLQLILESLDTPKEQPVLIAAETGSATTVLAARNDGQLLFSRTLLARWDADPARLGVEVNRSLLYAKQQFSALIDRVWLLGEANEAARGEVQTRCGNGKEITVRASAPVDWLQAVARLSPRHPVNLVAGYLGRKRRHQFVRRALIAGCWLGFGLLALDAWTRSSRWQEEHKRLASLTANETVLHETRARLEVRNKSADVHRLFIKQASEDRLPQVPSRLLAFISSTLPADANLTDFNVKWEPATGVWSFRLEGQIEGDEETAREALTAFQKQLVKSPLRARFNDATRVIVPIPVVGTELPAAQRFNLEGTLFEN
ncbi:MAG: hypothetical protein QM760_08790 [Nibricoccus sp.]